VEAMDARVGLWVRVRCVGLETPTPEKIVHWIGLEGSPGQVT